MATVALKVVICQPIKWTTTTAVMFKSMGVPRTKPPLAGLVFNNGATQSLGNPESRSFYVNNGN